MINAIANPQPPTAGSRSSERWTRQPISARSVVAARARWPGTHLQARQGQANREGRGRGQRRRKPPAEIAKITSGARFRWFWWPRTKMGPPRPRPIRTMQGLLRWTLQPMPRQPVPQPPATGVRPVARAPFGGASRPPRRNVNNRWRCAAPPCRAACGWLPRPACGAFGIDRRLGRRRIAR